MSRKIHECKLRHEHYSEIISPISNNEPVDLSKYPKYIEEIMKAVALHHARNAGSMWGYYVDVDVKGNFYQICKYCLAINSKCGHKHSGYACKHRKSEQELAEYKKAREELSWRRLQGSRIHNPDLF